MNYKKEGKTIKNIEFVLERDVFWAPCTIGQERTHVGTSHIVIIYTPV